MIKKNWDQIYKTAGIVQREIMPCVKKFHNLISNNNPSSCKILDSGCGTGRHFVWIAEQLADKVKIEMVGIDSSAKACLILNEIIKKTTLMSSRLKANVFTHNLNNGLPFDDGYFDGIISTLVIQHGLKSQIISWCEEMKRVLKPSGLLVLAVPSVEDPRYHTGQEIEPNTRINTAQKDGSVPHHFFSKDEIEKELFGDFEIVYRNLLESPSVTSNVVAKHLEYVMIPNK